ncbi:MAG: hypothetical protein WD904_04200 [Dehalococcoidia bacterium]
MSSELREKLVEAAKRGTLIHYEDIAPMFGLNFDLDADRAEVGRLLDVVSRSEHAARRPLLSAVVVHKGDDEIPGAGFFKLARELGTYKGGDRKLYWTTEFMAVCRYWKESNERSVD